MTRSVERARLSVKVRDNAGRKLKSIMAPKIARAMSEASENIRFMPLEDSDSLFSHFIKRYNEISKNENLLVRFYNLRREALADIHRLKAPEGMDVVYIFFQDSDKMGCMEIKWSKLVQNALDILDVDGDTISVCDKNVELGVILDKEELPRGVVWEMVGWGGVTLPTI